MHWISINVLYAKITREDHLAVNPSRQNDAALTSAMICHHLSVNGNNTE